MGGGGMGQMNMRGGYAGGGSRPPQQPTKSIWVGNLPPDCQESELHQAFSEYGPIDIIKVESLCGYRGF